MPKYSLHRYRIYMFIQGLTVLAVLSLFRLIPERALAGLVAGILFVCISSGIWLYELRFGRAYRSLSFWGCLLFLVISALPILFIRLAHWGIPWNSLVVLGWTGPQWHQFSNLIFGVMLMSHFLDAFLEARRSRN